ncbi:potassium transporter 10-like isoform X2 [Cornus florida]|uniref:potassium transporter 10-like isoform X2 n=1 Tax=Cornus florida TaxID=4283 RepID=UPI0028A2AEFA|nr:potassium transporter 10-like isoform X2 [Cornus florida]
MHPREGSASISRELEKETWRHTILLSFQSLGIVYGRLSTAPLYVFGTISAADIKSHGQHELFSFVFWTLTIIPLLKYALIVLRADDNGEGGTFALYSLLCRHAKVGLLPNERSANEILQYEEENPSKIKVESGARRAIEKHKSSHYLMLFLALFGSCMIIADGVLTPAISVLSASSGLQRSLVDIYDQFSSSQRRKDSAERIINKYLPVPAACTILVCLFTMQHFGTHRIGFIFAPVIIIWILFISGVGLYNIVHYDPEIICAISPQYMLRFIRSTNFRNWKSLGSILLCIAGSEAMFPNLGHLSNKSIKVTFVCLVYPALILCYAGQAAFISKNLGEDITHLTESVPNSFIRHIFTVLSLFASAIGSQATISASFSIINQCLALSCFPRVKVIHTSDKIHGQIYISDVNWVLMVISLAVTIGFHDTAKIGNVAGIVIICGMLVTTCLMSLVIVLHWEKSLVLSACFLVWFGSVEIMYLSACVLNFHKAAWSIVSLLALLMTIMLAWHYGTLKKYNFDLENKVSLNWLIDLSPGSGVSRVPGIGFIYTDIVTGIPAFFSHFITNLPAFHQVLIFVSFKSLPVPYVPPSRRYLIGRVGPKEYKVYRCIVRDESDLESLISLEGRMIVIGSPTTDGSALIPLNETTPDVVPTCPANDGIQRSPLGESLETDCAPIKRKRVRFTLPPSSPKMPVSVREELQELVDARESGTAYFLGHSHLSVRNSANFLKRFLIGTYVFLDKNCREPPVALNIPHAALVEIGMIYTI